MSSFTQHIPANSILCGCGVVTSGLSLCVHSDQPIGAPALRGDFTLLSEDETHAAAFETHLGDEISHNAFVRVKNSIPKTGEQGNFEAIHSELVLAVEANPQRIELLNQNLLGRQAWELAKPAASEHEALKSELAAVKAQLAALLKT